MSELLKRSITGFILVSVMVSSIYFGAISAMIIFIIIAFFTLNEFYGLMQKISCIKYRFVHALAGAYIVLVSFLASMQMFSKWMLAPYFLYYLYLFVVELYKIKGPSIQNVALSILGHIYIALPFASLAWMGVAFNQSYHPILTLAVFVLIWMNDSGAYLVGCTFGKHKLFERISPNKTWEGFVGGLLFAIVASIGFSNREPILSIYQWIGFAIVVSTSATYGDLFESFLKRSLGIKDSGNLLPGHGGMLDRFDAPLLAIPAVMIYLYLFS